MFRVEGIDHVALTVRDVARSVAWYREVLGLERRHAEVWGDFPPSSARAPRHSRCSRRGCPRRGRRRARDVLSVRHIAFRVDGATFGRARAHLEARGIAPTFEDHIAAHSLYFTDPDGHQLEITTYELCPIAHLARPAAPPNESLQQTRARSAPRGRYADNAHPRLSRPGCWCPTHPPRVAQTYFIAITCSTN
jgi:catechol 2,3-dioxygenase-like lactoylglutathione lyase family enzyme